MIKKCHLCNFELSKFKNIEHGSIQYKCTYRKCKGRKTGFSFNFKVRDNQITHVYVPLVRGDELYSVKSTGYIFLDKLNITEIKYYNPKLMFMNFWEEGTLFKSSDFLNLPLDFMPVVDKFLDRYLNLQTFI